MLANIIIMILILGYCAFVIYKSVKNSKEGKHMGCAGCSGNCGIRNTKEGECDWFYHYTFAKEPESAEQ